MTVSIVHARESGARRTILSAARSIRSDGAVASVTVVRRPNGHHDVYVSNLDAEQAIGMLTRAAYSIDRDARGSHP